jgi:hypothetical protein
MEVMEKVKQVICEKMEISIKKERNLKMKQKEFLQLKIKMQNSGDGFEDSK